MKKSVIWTSVLVVIAMLTLSVLPVSAAATPLPKIDLKAQRALICPDIVGNPIVNVTMRVVNNGDSAVHGNTWATDRYTKKITIWTRSSGGYCAQVSYSGRFVTLAGDSPNGTGTVAAGVKGTMKGGYIATFDGDFAPTRNTRGSIGYYDYRCATDYNVCRGYDFVNAYFENSANFTQVYWAWNYATPHNGGWHNGSDSNVGDIN